jgi:ribonuclease D
MTPVSPRLLPSDSGPDGAVSFVDTPEGLLRLLREMKEAGRVAVDIESNGMFAYHPLVCTVQLAWETKEGSTRVAVVDTLAVPLASLSELLGNPRVLKVIHDLAFDARMLRAEGVPLRSVRDTSVAATYLAKPGTGLASLLAAELDVHVSKEMQNSDWARRPLSDESLAYLAGDVSHLLQLDALLARQVREAGIADEVATETAYRLVDALEAPPEPEAPHIRIRGAEKLNEVGWRVIEAIARTREELARDKNLPPQRILGDRLLVAMAERPPQSDRELLRIGLVKRLTDDERAALLASITTAVAETRARPGSTQRPPRPAPMPAGLLAMRKSVEKRLQTWRRAEAERRRVHEQVVLPTHCIRWIVSQSPTTEERIASLPGLGPARATRYAKRLAELTAES